VRYVQRDDNPELRARIRNFLQNIQWNIDDLEERCDIDRKPKFGHCAETWPLAYFSAFEDSAVELVGLALRPKHISLQPDVELLGQSTYLYHKGLIRALGYSLETFASIYHELGDGERMEYPKELRKQSVYSGR